MCKTEYFESHFNAFVISLTNVKMLVKISFLKLPWPILSNKTSGSNFIAIPFYIPDVDEVC